MPSSPVSAVTATRSPSAIRLRRRLHAGSLAITTGFGLLAGAWIWIKGGGLGPGATISVFEALGVLALATLGLYLAVWRLGVSLLRQNGHFPGTDVLVSHHDAGTRAQQIHQLLEVLPDGALILSKAHVAHANAAASTHFGFGSASMCGLPLQSLVATADYPQLERLLQDAAAAVPTMPMAQEMCRRDGSVFRASLSAGCLHYGGRQCWLLVVRDFSEPERMRDALAESNAELQAMARRLFSLQEDERRAISRDLHDDIGQAITAMKLSVHAIIDEDDELRRRSGLAEVLELADSTVARLRNLSMLLRPPQLDALGLEAALRWQATMLFRASQVRLRLEVAALPVRPCAEIEQACFRIAQESLTNAMRHACAGEVTLTLDVRSDQLELRVNDDGDGFAPDGPRGLGLIIMRERAQSAGGTLQIDSAPGAGTRVSLLLPYSRIDEFDNRC